MNKAVRNSILVLLALSTSVMLMRYFTVKKTAVLIPDPTTCKITLVNEADFDTLSSQPLSTKYSGVKTVKVVYDLQQQQLYFIDGHLFTYHFEFCRDVLGYHQGLENFNKSNYSNTSKRNYVLANLNFYSGLNIYALEFVTEDDVKATYVKQLFSAVEAHSFLTHKLALLMNGAYLEKLRPALQDLTLVSPEQIYDGLQYQLIQEGIAYGKLYFTEHKDLDSMNVSDCILVLKGTPLLIPECQGIITDQFQTPLSHIQILAHHQHIPSFAWKKTGDSAFQKYAGKWVKLSIGTDRFHLQEIKYSDYLQHKLKPAVSSVRLKSDIQSPELIQLSQCTKADQNKIGNKAYHFSILQKISHSNPDLFSVPAGSFAIPFYYYQQQINQPVVRSQLQLICKQHPHWNRDHLSAELKKLRKLIQQQALNPALLQGIEQQIRSNQVGNSYRFRSSSNAEDAAGFSGAGLYKSATGIYGQTEKSIGQAIQKVWASTWSLQAFLAREQAGIRHEDVKMGILCHTNFGNEDANGVVVTKNIYRPSFSGYTANVQIGEISVVKPDDAVVCDQFTFFEASAFYAGQAPVAVDYITTGNQLGGRKVLTQEQITQLYKTVHACVTYYQRTLYSPHTFDIEFKFLNGKLYLKQIRPYD